MRTLAIETSGHTFSVALSHHRLLVSELFWHSGLSHSERLVPAVARLLKEAAWEPKDLERIAVSTGPGSFTGIRVGLSCARTMAQGLKIPLVGVDTLELLAAGASFCGYPVCAIVDALRGEVYVKDRKSKKVGIKTVQALCEGLKKEGSTFFVGSGVLTHSEEIRRILGKKAVFAPNFLNFPRAGILSLTSEKKKGERYDKILPLYIRRSWAEEKR